MSDTIRMYGAEWCGDCRRTSKQLNDLGVAYDYIDLEAQPDQVEVAAGIAGRKNIPVVVYPDGTHHVEPSNRDVCTDNPEPLWKEVSRSSTKR